MSLPTQSADIFLFLTRGSTLLCSLPCVFLVGLHRFVCSLVPLHASFEPGLVNSVVYLFGVTRYVATFLGNYQGEPFMQPIFRNRALIISLCICISMVILLTTGILPGLNHALDIVVGETWEVCSFYHP